MPVRIEHPFSRSRAAVQNDRNAPSAIAQLRERVLGREVEAPGINPFIGGAQNLLSAATLGIVPEARPGSLDPFAFDEGEAGAAQQKRFGELGSLQQQVVKARTPEDFASIIENAELFADAPSPDAVTDAGRATQDFNNKFITEEQRQAAQGIALSEPDAGPRQFTKFNDAGQEVVLDVNTGEEIARGGAKPGDGGGLSEVDRIKFEEKERSAFRKKTEGWDTASQAYLTLDAAFQGSLDGVQQNVVDANKFLTVTEGDSNATNDLAMIFAFMKMLDPTSVVRESEQANATNARGVPESIRNQYNEMLEGDKLTPKQRARMHRTAQDNLRKRFGSYRADVKSFHKVADELGLRRTQVAPVSISDSVRNVVLDLDDDAGTVFGEGSDASAPAAQESVATQADVDAVMLELGEGATPDALIEALEARGLVVP